MGDCDKLLVVVRDWVGWIEVVLEVEGVKEGERVLVVDCFVDND